jgi:hypothetical protein
MIKLKPIAEQLIQEADDMPTWGEVKQAFEAIVGKQNKDEAKKSLTKLGKFGMSLLPGLDLIQKGLDAYDSITQMKDVAGAMLSLGKAVATDQLKNPKGSEFKQLSSPFWDAIRLDPEVSVILDDKIEKQFIDQIIMPNLKKGGNDSEKIPNMNYELGKWLNKSGLDKADIFFKGKEGDL